MKLEDCTKEELIYILNRHCWRYINDTSELEFDVLMYRSEQTNQAATQEAEKESRALGEYIQLLKPYEGKRMIDIPENIIKKASDVMERYKRHRKAYKTLREKHDKIQKLLDININEKGG